MGALNYRPDSFTGEGNDNKQVEDEIETMEQTYTDPQAPNSPKLRVFLISLDEKGQHDSIFQRLHSKILKKASIDRAKTPSAVLRYLKENTPHSIILTDASLANHDPHTIPIECIAGMNHKLYNDVKEAVFDYVRGGGIVVCACSFAAFLFIKDRDDPTIPFFDKIGLPWCAATYSYYRTTFHVNNKAVPEDATPTLPRSYSQKALNLFQVEPKQCWYLPDKKTSWMESNSSHSRPNPQWTPVAFAKVELGFFGYIGDVNAQVETDDVVLAMCSLTVNIRDCFELEEKCDGSIQETGYITIGFLPSDTKDENNQGQIGTPTESRRDAELEGYNSDDDEFWSAAESIGSVEEFGVIPEKLETVADEEYNSDIEDFDTVVEVMHYISAQPVRRVVIRDPDEDDFWGLD
jgi:hypothetical protein